MNMKKAIIIILTLVYSHGFAQVMGGLNYSTIDTKRRTSFHAGLFLEKDYKRITYRVEGYYSDQGDKQRSQRYINFGILPQYYFKGFFITAGAQLGLLLNSTGETERVNQSSFGILTGVGYRVDRFTLSARYTHGLSSNVQSPVSENRYPHRVGQLTLSYRWKYKRHTQKKWLLMNWTSVRKDLPKKYGRYLVYREGCNKIHFQTWNGTQWAYDNHDITHWSIPKNPKNKSVI